MTFHFSKKTFKLNFGIWLTKMTTGNIIQMALIGFQIWLAFNVFFIIPHIDRLTEFTLDSHSFSLSKRMRYIIMFAGVFVFLFVPIIKYNRKKYHIEYELEFLKKHNHKGNKDNKILKIERTLKLSEIKRKTKRKLWHL